jgi:predicted 3-demethylubiquinone-9 3-methyltransferase (glyoxalase superfamily)
MQKIQTITPFLWFDDQAEEAAKFYTAIFKNCLSRADFQRQFQNQYQ